MSGKNQKDDVVIREAKKKAIQKLHIPSSLKRSYSVTKKGDCIVLSSKKK